MKSSKCGFLWSALGALAGAFVAVFALDRISSRKDKQCMCDEEYDDCCDCCCGDYCDFSFPGCCNCEYDCCCCGCSEDEYDEESDECDGCCGKCDSDVCDG